MEILIFEIEILWNLTAKKLDDAFFVMENGRVVGEENERKVAFFRKE